MGHDAQPSVLLGDGQHLLPPKTACNGVTETAPASWQRQRGLCQLLSTGGCREARGRGAKKGGSAVAGRAPGSRATPLPICTVSPKLCGAGSRVKTRGARLDRVLLGWDDVRGATLQWGRRRKVNYLPCTARMYPQTTDIPPNLPVNQLGARAGSRAQAKWAPDASRGCQGGGPVLPAASLQSQATPRSNQWLLREAGGPLPPSQNRPGLQPQATYPTGAHPSPLPQSPGHSPHLSGNVIGSLGRCVGYLGGYHHHLGSGRIHMGRGARPGRRVTLHAGRAGGRLRPVLVEMLGERRGTASGGAPAPPPGTDGRRGETHPTHLRGSRLGPPNPAHARCGPLPARRGPAAPAPGAGHGRTQLGGGRSRRASHQFPALALNAGTCSPAVPSHARAGQPGRVEPAIPPPGPCCSSRPSFFAGQEHPQEQQLKPSSEWARKGLRTHPGARKKHYLKRPESSLLASARVRREKEKERDRSYPHWDRAWMQGV